MDKKELIEKCKNPFFAAQNKNLCDLVTEYRVDEVRDYLKKNKERASIKSIINYTNIDKKYIEKWILTGRIEEDYLSEELLEYKRKTNQVKKEFKEMIDGERIEKMFNEAQKKEEKRINRKSKFVMGRSIKRR
ncbi:MAG: hypothetical protein N4A54_03230 [Peptostreptococcaceae bacterium]|jgi:hypothetical protein|nr:hypothetical protein [Peptostreptococcaceae bacterium]